MKITIICPEIRKNDTNSPLIVKPGFIGIYNFAK